jgi:hypothetical protein
MSLIAERMEAQARCNALDFTDRKPDLTTGAPLRALYSHARLTSDQARRVVLLPDLAGGGGLFASEHAHRRRAAIQI